MKKCLSIITLIFMLLQMNAQSIDTISLYQDGIVPYNKANIKCNEFIQFEIDSNRRIYAVVIPELFAFYPEKPNYKAIIICPGGGYSFLSIDKEGIKIAEQLSKWGYTCFVLKYRIPNSKLMDNKENVPLIDAHQAMCIVRDRAQSLQINKIGVMGFSAGGHLAATLSTQYDFGFDSIKQNNKTSLRPDFSILIYPVISFDSTVTHLGSVKNLLGTNPIKEQISFFSADLNISHNSPPVFIMHNSDDETVQVENSIRYYQACIKNKVPAEMHIYKEGGHGIGMYNKTTNDSWVERLKNWLENI